MAKLAVHYPKAERQVGARMKQEGPKQRSEGQRAAAPKPATVRATQPKAAAAAGHRYAGAAAARSPTATAPIPGAPAVAGSELDAQALALQAGMGAQLAAGADAAHVPQEGLAAILLAERQYLPKSGPGGNEALPIRFEPYVFYQQTGRWLAATHRDQGAEQRVFEQACALDPAAAHASLRMGLAQISGAESAGAGFVSPEAMRQSFAGDPVAQVAALVQLAGQPGPLQQALAGSEWAQVALLRAGPGYGALGYDQALSAAAEAYKRVVKHGGGDDDDEPKRRKRS